MKGKLIIIHVLGKIRLECGPVDLAQVIE